MTPRPDQVSVVMCVRDGGAFLAEALTSAWAEGPAEVVVADDGSSDDSASIAEASGARVLRLGAVGPTPARNAALAAATGDLVACLDADDRWPEGRLAVLCAALGDQDGVFGSQLLFGDGVTPVVVPGRSMGTLLLRRGALETVGPLDESLAAGAVVDWLARLAEPGLGLTLGTVPEVVLERRVHDTNFSHTARESVRQDYVRAAHAALQRRRGR